MHPDDIDLKTSFLNNDRNNSSVVLGVSFAGKRILYTGDLGARGWKWIINRNTNLKADILKFPHHGAWYETKGLYSLVEVLTKIDPSLVIISVGTNNKHKHPHPETLRLLRSRPFIRILCTQATKQCFPTLAGSKDTYPCAGTIEVKINEQSVEVHPQFQPPCQIQHV